jgi:hypothetical protein
MQQFTNCFRRLNHLISIHSLVSPHIEGGHLCLTETNEMAWPKNVLNSIANKHLSITLWGNNTSWIKQPPQEKEQVKIDLPP